MPRLLRFEPGGVGQYFGEPGQSGIPREVHHVTCAHCQKGTEFPSKREMMNYVEICRGCMKLICLECAGKPCRPWEKECERQENEQRLRLKIECDHWKCY